MSNQPDLDTALINHPLVGGISDDSMAWLCRAAHLRRFRAGDVVWHAEEAVETVYLVVSGQIRFDLEITEGHSQFIGLTGAGGYFGDLEVLNGTRPLGPATATQHTWLVAIPQARFRELFEREPGISRIMARIYSFNVRRMQMIISVTLNQDTETRLALLLQTLLNETAPQDGKTIDLKLTQEHLAGMLGITRQSLSRPLQRWKQNGWIAFRNHRVEVLEPEALRQLCNLDLSSPAGSLWTDLPARS